MIQHLNDSMIQYPKAMPLVPENRSPLSCLGREAAGQESPLRFVALSLPDAPPAECNGLHNPAPRALLQACISGMQPSSLPLV
jgi:hypothetical protein